MPLPNSRWIPAFQDWVYGALRFGLRIEMPVSSDSSGTDAEGAGCVSGGRSEPSVTGFPMPLEKSLFGKFWTPATNGGLPFRFVNRFPKIRSWKIPYPARNDVLPVPNGSHASPRRGSKLL